jgi:hypothetical protein
MFSEINVDSLSSDNGDELSHIRQSAADPPDFMTLDPE